MRTRGIPHARSCGQFTDQNLRRVATSIIAARAARCSRSSVMSNSVYEGLKAKRETIHEVKVASGHNVLTRRDFFWDNVVLLVVWAILALAAVDIVIEFVRRGEVACFPPNANSSDGEVNYINRFCASKVPFGSHILLFMVSHGLLIAIPHYLWLNQYAGSCRFFFQLVATLQKIKESDTGQYSTHNSLVVEQLQETFSRYRHGHIFHLYIVKLIFQLAWIVGGLVFASIFFHGRFGPSFNCPNTSEDRWSIGTDVTCVFDTLNLLQVLWVAEILLLILAAVGLMWALIWCFSVHPKELGSSEIAAFSYYYGLRSQYYVPNIPLLYCCGTGLRYLFQFSRASGGPRIKTNMDFMMMVLYNTDGGVGHILKEGQVGSFLKQLCDDDRRRLNVHARKHRNIRADNHDCQRHSGEVRDKQMEVEDLMWTFCKEHQKVGIYRDFQTLLPEQPVALPGTIRGTVLGFAARAPDNGSAIEVSFGNPSFATALARVFKWATALHFSSDYKAANKAFYARQYYAHMLSLTCSEDIFSSESPARAEFLDGLKAIWVRPGSASFLHTSFIVLGPIPEENSYHLTTVDQLLETVAGCLSKDAVLLVVRPLQISNKDVTNLFCSYKPPQPSFEPLEQTYDVINQVQEWMARKSSFQPSPHHSIQTPGTKQSLFRFHIVSGDVPCIMEFTTYHYTDNPHRNLPDIYRPTPPPLVVSTLPRGPSDINLSRDPDMLNDTEGTKETSTSVKQKEGSVIMVPYESKETKI